MIDTPIDISSIKARQKATWQSGDYAKFATYMYEAAVNYLKLCAIPSNARVLDVACGAGQTALPLARNGNAVVGLDVAANLVVEARRRAAAEGLTNVQFDEGDAEQMPYDDAAFDVIFSLVGAMFAAQPDKVASELARVCRPGGRIIMGNWTSGGFVGQMFKTMSAHVPPPKGIPAPTLWGDEETVRQRFGNQVSDLKLTRRLYPFTYPFGPVDVVEFFRANYGPTNRAFAGLDADGQAALRYDLEELWTEHNQATDGTTYVLSEYLDVQAIR